MKNYDVVGLMYTRTCPLACKDCITESSPNAKGRMRFDQARSYLPAIAKYARTVCFTGGEPFLHYRDILQLTREAKSLGLDVTIVSGAGWVRKEKLAQSRMQELATAGVSTICISWDKYHEEFSTANRAAMLARLAFEANLKVKVRSVIPAGDPPDGVRVSFGEFPINFQSVLPIALGRAASLPASHFLREEDPPRSVCGVVKSPNIDFDGTVYACCGPSLHSAKTSTLVLGNANEEPLENIFARAVKNPILQVLEILGSYGFYELLKGHRLEHKMLSRRAEGYSTICDLCLDVTNNPELVAAVVERLEDKDAKTLVAAAKLWRDRKLLPVAGTQRYIGAKFNKPLEEVRHAD